MNTQKLLALRELTPIEKLVMLALIDKTIFGESSLTSKDIATAIGSTRRVAMETIQKLEEMDYITCKVEVLSEALKQK